eukprot:TRINITY_DN20012_c0_g1_i4.p1 TRINITY_DN20012_c0_g1~~TRINITY_DN20012_c0_g1_i4.p1  ORF type:complete len:421 (-),score=88.46 TRINITY_DN20012_c0_g1_i4:223-1485(-)
MPGGQTDDAFIDYYELLESSPETNVTDLKRIYRDKLREYHPDKRPNSSTGTGVRVTQALNEAWEILQDPTKRAVYDTAWCKQRQTQLKPKELAEAVRREGNELYKEAQSITKRGGADSLTAVSQALPKYQGAIAKYTEALGLCTEDHRIYSNRALCYAALKFWPKCQADALRCTQLKPDFMKGWFLLAKAHWKTGQPLEALRQVDAGLSLLPDSMELLQLKQELQPEAEACLQQGAAYLPKLNQQHGRSRSVSPACTPCASRVQTPPPLSGRPADVPQQTQGKQGRKSSRSPTGATTTQPTQQAGRNLRRQGTGEFGEQTAAFGASAVHGGTNGHGDWRFGPSAPGTFGMSGTWGTFGPPKAAAQAAPVPPSQPLPPGHSSNHDRSPGRRGSREPPPPQGSPSPPRGRFSLAGMANAARK